MYYFPLQSNILTGRDLLFLAIVQGEASASQSRMIEVQTLQAIEHLVDAFQDAQLDAQSPEFKPEPSADTVVGQAPDQAQADALHDAAPRAIGRRKGDES